MKRFIFVAALVGLAGSASAQTPAKCPADMTCLPDPAEHARCIEEAGKLAGKLEAANFVERMGELGSKMGNATGPEAAGMGLGLLMLGPSLPAAIERKTVQAEHQMRIRAAESLAACRVELLLLRGRWLCPYTMAGAEGKVCFDRVLKEWNEEYHGLTFPLESKALAKTWTTSTLAVVWECAHYEKRGDGQHCVRWREKR